MHRTLIATIAIGLALSSLGCAHRRYHDQAAVDHADTKNYYERHLVDRNRGGLGGRLDLNRASSRELDGLPGLSHDDAHRILENRPYAAPHDLIARRIIDPGQYDVIEQFVYVCRLCAEPCGQVHRCAACCERDHPVMERRG
jgi:hypothetical protein